MLKKKVEETRRRGMVDWYSPLQLIDTGIRTLVSVSLGNRIDSRLFNAAADPEASCFDFSDREELWFDYAADTGDGWNPTFSLAYLLSAPFQTGDGSCVRDSDLVILGGDEVYPVASRENYEQKLVLPFEEAARVLGQLEQPSRHRDIFLIPGNHDWYDSLASFTRRFLAGRRLGLFETRQKQSYFILKLPHHWHLWATDIQLGRDIDVQQYKFFSDYAGGLDEKDRVILCSAEPEITYGHHSGEELCYTHWRMENLVRRRGARVPIKLAGDVHNYQRYEGVRKTLSTGRNPSGEYDQIQVVSGGGGAFLHPTHVFDESGEKAGGFKNVSRYPDPETSRKLNRSNFLFVFKHYPMTFFFGLLLTAMFWQVRMTDHWFRFPLDHPVSLLMMIGLIAGAIGFSGRGNAKITSFGVLHGMGMIAVGALGWWAGHRASDLLLGFLSLASSGWWHEFLRLYLAKFLSFAICGCLGGTLFGTYLVLSLNLLKNHHTEAFGALSCPHYKNFLRCRIDKNGDLRVRAIGIPKVVSEQELDQLKTQEIEPEFVVS